MPINKNELTIEQIEEAMQCKTADDLMELAKAEGFAITKDEAEAYMAELSECELKDGEIRHVAGGLCGNADCPHLCADDYNR